MQPLVCCDKKSTLARWKTRMGAQTDAKHKPETLNPKQHAQRREGAHVLAAQKVTCLNPKPSILTLKPQP
jgi:hypothetical protein